MSSWKNIIGWKYNFMTDNQVKEHLVINFPQLNLTSLYLEKPILAYDLFRYSIIYLEGGLYADSDVGKDAKFEESILELTYCNVIVGVEVDLRYKSDWIKDIPRALQINQWSFYSTQNHQLMKLVVERVSKKIEYYQSRGISLKDVDVMEVTGPAIWTDIITDYILLTSGVNIGKQLECGVSYRFGDVCILNIRGFLHTHLHSCNEGADSKNSFILSDHYYLGSWKN